MTETLKLEKKILDTALKERGDDNAFVLTALIMAALRFASDEMKMPPYAFIEIICLTMGKRLGIDPPENLLEFVAEGMKAQREEAIALFAGRKGN